MAVQKDLWDPFQGLTRDEFVPYFQPLIALRTGQLVGFEILARWRHPVEGLIAPCKFIAVAERDNWIAALTRQILSKALAAAVALPDHLTLAINISPIQLRDAGLAEEIRGLTAEAGFALSRLIIEVTESALIDDLESAKTCVAQLKGMGCKVALDDFGTGYSSLHHLQSLPFDELKVDRSFVSSMTEKRESRKIVSAVVGLGQTLGLITIAEGIETLEQAEMVLWLGCDIGQGYFYGRPLPAESLPACVEAKRGKLPINSGSAWKKISAANLNLSPTQRLAQLQAVYDGAPVGLAFLDHNLRFVNVNQRLADMNGANIEDHLGSPVAEITPELFLYVEPYIRRALGGESLTDVETQLSDTGETRLISYLPVKDEGDEVVGVSMAVVDISERKRVEEALKESEAHYRSIVDLNPQVLWIMDSQGRNLDVSPRWDRKTGLLKSQSTEHEWLTGAHPGDLQSAVSAIAESRRNGSAIDVHYRTPDGKGGWRWKRSRGAPRFDGAGNIVCWYGSVEDVGAPCEDRKSPLKFKPPIKVQTSSHIEGVTVDSANRERRIHVLNDLEILDTSPEAAFIDIAPRTLSPQQTKTLTILSHRVQPQIDLRSERRKPTIETQINDSSALASNQMPEANDDAGYGSELAGMAPPLTEGASMRTLDLGNFGLWLGGSANDAMARHILNGLSNGVTISDATLPGAPLIYINPAFERMTGYSGEDVVGLSCNFLQGVDQDQPAVHQIRSAIREAREERVTLRNYRKDGTRFWNELYLSPIFNATGKLSHFIGVQNDVTAEIEAKLQLSEERDRLQAASECSMDCLYICEAIRDEGGEIIDFTYNFLNSNAAELASLPKSALMGARMCEVLPINQELGLFDLYKRVVLSGEPLVHEFAKVDQDECSSWMRVQAVKLKDGVVITASDITLRKREEERTVFKAEHDPLTALPNRSVLRDRVESGLLWAKRHEGMLGVFLIDLDGFKAINDNLGHAAGDEALVTVASRLTTCMRKVDSVIRIGGDEFVIVLPELRRQSDAEALAARILDVLRTPMRIEDQDVCVTSSIGVALYPQTARTTEELLSRSDAAMYLAKRGGKNKYEIYPLEKVKTTSELSFVIA